MSRSDVEDTPQWAVLVIVHPLHGPMMWADELPLMETEQDALEQLRGWTSYHVPSPGFRRPIRDGLSEEGTRTVLGESVDYPEMHYIIQRIEVAEDGRAWRSLQDAST